MRTLKTIALLLFLQTAAWGQLAAWESYGYIKYLYSYTEAPLFTAEKLSDHTLHARLNNRWYPLDGLTGALELRARAFYGGSVENIPGYENFIATSYPFDDFDARLWKSSSSLGHAQIDRLYFDYIHGNWQVTAGRQRVAWGTALVWNITDLFNPYSVLDFDYEERPGSDALRLQYFTSPVSRLEAVAVPAPDEQQRAFALMWSSNFNAYDFYAIGGKQRGQPFAGGAFSGDIAGAGFRGELLWTKSDAAQAFPGLKRGSKDNVRAVLSADYTWSSGLYIHAEALYNSLGVTKNAALYAFTAPAVGLLSPARASFYYEISYPPHPLWRLSLFALHNPYDGSFIAVPSVTWSVATNLDLFFIAFTTDGAKTSEFGSTGNGIWLRLSYAFTL